MRFKHAVGGVAWERHDNGGMVGGTAGGGQSAGCGVLDRVRVCTVSEVASCVSVRVRCAGSGWVILSATVGRDRVDA